MPTLNLGCDDDPRLASDAPFVSLAQQAQIVVPSIRPEGTLPPAMKRSPYETAEAAAARAELVRENQPEPSSSSSAAVIDHRAGDVGHTSVEQPAAAIKKELKTASIGTDLSHIVSSFNEETDVSHVGTGQRSKPKMDLAEVAGSMIKLQRLIHNDGKPIAVTDFESIDCIVSLCDQLFYWGVAEARFPDVALSMLCECEAVPTLARLMVNDRSALMIASLTALGAILQHPRSAAIFCKLPGVFDVLFESYTKYPNKEEVLLEALVVSRYAASLGGCIDTFLSSQVISAIIKTMQSFPNNMEIQKRCALFFADIVSIPRTATTEKGDPVAPTGVLFAQIGSVTEHVLLCFRQQPTSSVVADAVSHYCKVVSSYPMNLKRLLSEKEYLPICQEIAANSLNTPKVIVNALLALAAAIPALKISGKRFFVIFLRDILIKSREVSVIRCVVSLQHAILRSCEQEEEAPAKSTEGKSVRFEEGAANTPPSGPPQPSEYEAMKSFLVQNQIPQCISLALDHFGVASFPDEDGIDETEEFAVAQALSRTGVAALQEMSAVRFHWLR